MTNGVYCVAGGAAQRHSLERFVESAPGLRNLGSGNLSQLPPASADVVLAEVLPGETPQQRLEGRPYWLVLLDEPRGWESARALLPRRSSEAEVEAAIMALAQGLLVSHQDFVQPPPQPATTPLSAREQEVLACLALGRSNREIAAQLAITEHTVKFHLASIFNKLEASSRSQAVAAGLRRGLVKI